MKKIMFAITLFVVCGSLLADDEILDKRISLNLKLAAADQLFPLFGQLLGTEVDADFETDTKVNLVFDDITARTALNAFCETIRCSWSLRPGPPQTLRFYRMGHSPMDRRLELNLLEADAPQVFKLAAQILKSELTVDDALTGRKVTLVAEDSLAVLLDTICADIGCRWKFVEVERRLVVERR